MADTELRVKEKKPGQRACDEKDPKGRFCLGHLKRWYMAPEEVVNALGQDVEIYRCERCHALYRPSSEDRSSFGLKYDEQPVNLLGDPVRSGRG